MSVLFALWFLLLQSIDTANRKIPQYKGLQSVTVLLLLFCFLKTYLFRPILDAFIYSYPMRLEQLFSRTLSFWPVMIFFVLLLIASLVVGSAENSDTKRCRRRVWESCGNGTADGVFWQKQSACTFP